jgi:hypothetical protein
MGSDAIGSAAGASASPPILHASIAASNKDIVALIAISFIFFKELTITNLHNNIPIDDQSGQNIVT